MERGAEGGNRTRMTLRSTDFKSVASTNFATPAVRRRNTLEAWAGIEPAHVGFADRSVTTSPPRQSTSHV